MTLSVLAELDMTLGECPRWNAGEAAWYWVDIIGHTLYRFDTGDNRLTQQTFSFQPACFAFTATGRLILSSSQGLYLLPAFGRDPQLLADPEAGQNDQRFNDGTVLPNGDFVVGSIGDGNHATGVRYRFRFNEGPAQTTVLETGYTIINTQCCSPDGHWCYVADTPEQVIYRQTIGEQGILGKKERFYRCNDDEYPDGAATDSDGNLWVAMFGSSKIAVISPAGVKIKEIRLPAQQPTMVAFGGADRQQLIVTTARADLPDDAAIENGSVLILETQATGAAVADCPDPA